jgi:hypothetical protein
MLRVVAVAAAITPIGIAGCASEADKETIDAMVSTTTTFVRDTFPFTFEYPDGFEFTDDVNVSRTLGGGRPDESVAIAMDEDNLLLIERVTLEQEINQDNLRLAKQEGDELFQQVDPDARGAEGEIAGFPSLTYDAVTLPTPEEGESRFIMLFEGDEQYVINCQSTPDGRDEIEQACDLAVDTLTRRS